MLLSEPRCRRVMTTLVRASAVCLPLNDRNVECVCKQGRINFFHSPLYVSMLSIVISRKRLKSFLPRNGRFECFCLITIWILIHTFHTSAGFSPWHLSPLCVTSRPFLCVRVHHLFCLWLLAWVIMCAPCVYFTAWDRRGSPPTWGHCENVIVWLCSALWHSLYSSDDFSSPSVAFCFVCLESGMVNKW